jgi:hypothetical protein
MDDPWAELLDQIRGDLKHRLSRRHMRVAQQHKIVCDVIDETLDAVYSRIPFPEESTF